MRWVEAIGHWVPQGRRARARERCAAVQEIAEWLEKLGMSECGALAENRVDLLELPDSPIRMKDLGIPLLEPSATNASYCIH